MKRPGNFSWCRNVDGISVYFSDKKIFAKIDSGKAPGWAMVGWHLMVQLLESGDAGTLSDDVGIFLQSEDAVCLDEEYREQWGLPPSWPGTFRLETRSVPNARDFNAVIRVLDERGNSVPVWNLEGPILSIQGREFYLLTAGQFAILKGFRKWEETTSRTESDHLRFLHTLSEAESLGCAIDLRSAPDIEIKNAEECLVDVDERPDGTLRLTPLLKGLIETETASGDEVREQIRKRISQLDEGGEEAIIRVGKKIVLLDKDQTKTARAIANNPVVNSDQKENFLKDPAGWMADHVFVHNAVEFLPRVIGLGEWTGGYLGGGGELGESVNWFDKKPEPEDSRTKESSSDSAKDDPFEDAEDWEEDDDPIEDPGPLVPLIEMNDDDLKWGLPYASDAPVAEHNLEFTFEGYPRQPFPHQITAVEWLACHTARAGNPGPWKKGDTSWGAGALFADDMGLGKTFSTLLFIGKWYELWRSQLDKEPPACLVVAPLSLVENWGDEIKKSFPPDAQPFKRTVLAIPAMDLRSYFATANGKDIIESSEGEIRVQNYGLKFGDETPESLDYPGSIVITTYQTLRDYRFSFAGSEWGVVALDEAQNIKNPNALQTVAAKALKGFFRVALTGTPVENHLGDLWSLMDMVEPGALGSFAEFRKRWIIPLRQDPSRMGELGQNLREYLDQIILRRTKEDSLDGLPTKTIKRVPISMTERQKDLYEEILELARQPVGDEAGAKQSNRHLTCMWELRRITLHPDLLGGGVAELPKDSKTSRRYLEKSGKLKWLLSLLDDIRKNEEKALIFCVQKQLQAMLVNHLSRIYAIKVPLINGDTKAASKTKPNETRLGLINSFCEEHGFGVCVLSPIAAGAGLNIVAANHVIHLERHWNPAKEDQATDRAFRIGQEKDVTVYLPILEHPREDLTTFDMGLDQLIGQKRSLAGSMGLIPISPITDQELFGVVLGGKGEKSSAEKQNRHLSLEEVQSLGWELFEALIAALYERESAEVILTPRGRDGGADSIVLGHQDGNRNFIVQCKFTMHNALDSAHAVQEVVGAKPSFEARLQKPLSSGVVHTNAARFSGRTKKAASESSVRLEGRKWLKSALAKHPITMAEIIDRNGRRRRV